MPADCSVLRTPTIRPSIRISWDYHPTFMLISGRVIILLLLDLHGQADALLRHIYGQYLYIHDIADADSLQRMFDIAVGDLRDVYQSVLMDTDIYKHTKVNDITHGSFQNHAGL